MSASILVHWPGASSEQEQDHPGFFNDDRGWATWVVNVLQIDGGPALVNGLGLAALLAHTTEGAEAIWTTPDELERAAGKLAELVRSSDAQVERLVELYEAMEDEATELLQDLEDVAAIARYARGHAASKLTLGYYW